MYYAPIKHTDIFWLILILFWVLPFYAWANMELWSIDSYVVCAEPCQLLEHKMKRLKEITKAYPYATYCVVKGDSKETLRAWCEPNL